MFIVIDCIDFHRILFFSFSFFNKCRVRAKRSDFFNGAPRIAHPFCFPHFHRFPPHPSPPRPIFTHNKLIEVYRRTYRFAYQPKCITKFDIDYNNNSTLLQHSLTCSFIHHHPFKYSLQAISCRELLWNHLHILSKLWIRDCVACFRINIDLSYEVILTGQRKRWRVLPSRNPRFPKPHVDRNSNVWSFARHRKLSSILFKHYSHIFTTENRWKNEITIGNPSK